MPKTGYESHIGLGNAIHNFVKINFVLVREKMYDAKTQVSNETAKLKMPVFRKLKLQPFTRIQFQIILTWKYWWKRRFSIKRSPNVTTAMRGVDGVLLELTYGIVPRRKKAYGLWLKELGIFEKKTRTELLRNWNCGFPLNKNLKHYPKSSELREFRPQKNSFTFWEQHTVSIFRFGADFLSWQRSFLKFDSFSIIFVNLLQKTKITII